MAKKQDSALKAINKTITELLQESQARIQEAKKLADEYGLSFSCNGGIYYGTNCPEREELEDDYEEGRGYFWMPSRC